MKKKKQQNGEYYNKAIAPGLGLAAKHRGFVARVTECFAAISGREVARQQVALWMHPDETKRVEPSYSNGVMLLQAIGEAYAGL